MNWLMKIVEGPVKGAEIALVEGVRLKVGSADTCDIVLSDNTVAGEAFELDVAPEAVTLIDANGAVSELVPFEIKTIGTTAFAVGPVEGDWKALVKKEVEKPAKASEPTVPEEKEEIAPEAVVEPAPEKKSRSHRWGMLVLLVLIVLLGAAVWYFWPKIVEKVPEAEEYRVVLVEKSVAGWEKTVELSRVGYDWTKEKVAAWFKEDKSVIVETERTLSLKEIAEQYDLTLTEADGVSTLVGNCRRRTERFAIRALAQAADPFVRFDLTDDESLRDASNELLFALTGGSLKAVAATNRVVKLVGYAETTDDLAEAIRALNQDVKNIVALETEEVRLGIKSPEPSIVPSPAESVVDKAAPEIKPTAIKEAKVQKKYLVAGILMKPYPCVVMRNGLRLVEGSELGTAHIERIEAGRIVLREGGATFVWEP